MSVEVHDNPDRTRYEVWQGGRLVGFSVYVPAADILVFTHTEIEPEFEGRGLGGALVRGALDDLRRRGLLVRPVCPFVASYIERHPQYADLVDGPLPPVAD